MTSTSHEPVILGRSSLPGLAPESGHLVYRGEVPLISVIIRSYQRPTALLELVSRLRTQSYPKYEIVILEQSDDLHLIQQLERLKDTRLRVVISPPRDPPAARNAAIQHARGSIFLFIDDDDLPLYEDWITNHVANYWDQECMGVVGRLVSSPTRLAGPRFPKLVRALAMRFTWFGDTRAYAHNTLRKKGIDFLIGSNASVRRSLVERIGAWDEGIPMNEEQSFSFRFAQLKQRNEHFTFDPRPVMWRRTDVPGGLARRMGADWYLREFEARLFFYRNVVGYYFPTRYRLLRPLYFVRALFQVFEWIWDPDNRAHPFFERLAASTNLFLQASTVLDGKRYSARAIRRVPSWPSPQ